jgi:hypothetical protein
MKDPGPVLTVKNWIDVFENALMLGSRRDVSCRRQSDGPKGYLDPKKSMC